MPDRRRRAGYRDAELSKAMRQALNAEIHELAGTEGALERIRLVGDFYAALDAELERIAQVRLEAVRELRTQGWSYARIAAATGLSSGRVAQLAREAKSGGRRSIAKT